MNKTMKSLFLIALTAVVFSFSSCARIPRESRSQSLIQKHFTKYGKKFPETIYGKEDVTKVEIVSTREIHKHLVSVESFITLSDGTLQRIFATIEKGSFGWRFVSWENAS